MSWPSSGTASYSGTPNKRQKLDTTEQPTKTDDQETETPKPKDPEPQNPPPTAARSACHVDTGGVPPPDPGEKVQHLGFENASDLFSDRVSHASEHLSRVSNTFVSDKTKKPLEKP